MDQMHYTDYVAGALPNQEIFCNHLKKKSMFGIIEDVNSNPMTIRLLLTREGLDQISSFCRGLNDHVTNPPKWVTEPGELAIETYLTHTTAASGCIAYRCGFKIVPPPSDPAVYKIVSPWKLIFGKVFADLFREDLPPVYLFNLYRGLYVYFTNFVSSLDRIRYEIEKLYNCPPREIKHWSSLTSPSKEIISWLNEKGWSELTKITTSTRSLDITKCCEHRHRLVHDGQLRTEVVSDMSAIRVNIPDDPNNPILWNEVSSFCDSKFRDLIILLDEIYKCMLNDI
jgi:hypothetical protein